MRKKRSILFAATIIGAFAAVVWFTDPFDLMILGVGLLVWIGMPAVLIGVILFLAAMGTGRSRRRPLILLSIVLGFACFVGLALPANHFIQERAVAEAKAYPSRVAPLLESYRRTHGAYPTTLDQIPSRPPLPRLLREFGYRSDGQIYFFRFAQPGLLDETLNYDSQTQTWHLSTMERR